jgi:PAS domain S-box-containing protein
MAVGPWTEQLEYFGPLLDHTEDAIVAVDPDWQVTMWNAGAEQMYGWSAAEIVGKHVPSFVRMDLGAERRPEARREADHRGRWRDDATVERRDGSTVSVEVINVAIRDEQDQITGYLGIHRDVTERNRIERELWEANRRAETILESITDSSSALDAEWRYVYLNPRAVDRITE